MAKNEINVEEIQEQFDEYMSLNPIFEPSPISMSVSNIFADIKNGTILKADFQRNFRWDLEKQSRLIESLFLGYTPPCLFAFYEEDEEGLERMRFHDGLQRSYSIFQFLDNKLTLKGLEVLDFLNGLKYSDLPSKLQNHINQRKITILEFPYGTPQWVVQEHFNRLNTTAEPLSMPETFRGAFYGKYYNIIEEMGSFDTFLNAMGNKGKGKLKNSREHEKYVMYWAAMFHNKIWNPQTVKIEYQNSPLTCGKYIAKNLTYWTKNEENLSEDFVNNLMNTFKKAVNLCVCVFGELPFRKPKIDKETKQFVMKNGEIAMNNTNNGMFECFMYLMSFADAESVIANASKIKSEFFNELLEKPEVYETFHNMCMNGKAAKIRFRFVHDLLTKCGVTFTNL